ncbi:sulfur carrier protein [Williamsia limnetica]|uniref:Sulfur carrier protein n=1 Tax=Williamsia limnetica TaxID=882452 RepID=A0A318RL60_WILLI|nr:sulfur carrier protein ThiS [Williamsia limnetica]PYE16822.1 sulfur carrier protein [Williamsia limnetica]
MGDTVIVNGEATSIPDGITVRSLLEQLALPDTGIAIAVDETVRPQSTWDDELGPCERIEILTAVQGG